MAVEKIVISVKHSEISKVKNILYNIFTNIPKIDVNIDEVDNSVELEFRIPALTFERVLTKFYANGINIKPINSQTKAILYGLKNSKMFDGEINYNKDTVILHSDITGYEDVVDAVEKFMNQYGRNNISEFNLLSKKLKDFIGTLKKEGSIKRAKANDNIPLLLQIASSEKLKSASFIDVMKEAGSAAIEICSIYPDYVGELVIISNDRRVPNIISLRAAAKFAEVAFGDRKKYAKDITIAKRRINKKWLENIFDVAGFELTDAEREYLKEINEM